MVKAIIILCAVQCNQRFETMELSAVYSLQGNTPLVKAAELGNLHVTEALLGAKAVVNARGKVYDKQSVQSYNARQDTYTRDAR